MTEAKFHQTKDTIAIMQCPIQARLPTLYATQEICNIQIALLCILPYSPTLWHHNNV